MMKLKKEIELINKIISNLDLPKNNNPHKISNEAQKINIKINNVLENFFKREKKINIEIFKPINEVIRIFCMKRAKFLKLKRFNKGLFIFFYNFFSINHFIILVLKKYILLSCRFSFSHNKIKNNNNKTAIVINFPEHSLSTDSKRNDYPSSFAESIREVGFSKIITYNIEKKENIFKKYSNKKFFSIKKKISFIKLIRNSLLFFKILSLLFINKKFPLILRLAILENELNIKFYCKLVNYINIYYPNTTLFFLPLQNPFPINYNKINKTGIYEYYYSANIFIPPILVSDIKGSNYKIKNHLSYIKWSTSNHAVGFKKGPELVCDENIKYLNKKIKNKTINNLSLRPTFFGYKSKTKLLTKNNVLVFDTYPIKKIESLQNLPSYNFYDDYFFVSSFLEEVVNIVPKKFNIYLKPKYSLLKSRGEYRNLLNKLKNENKNFQILDPYTDILNNTKNIKISINIPFVSSQQIMKKAGIKAVYYCPKKFKHLFKDCKNIDFITSKERLLSRLKR